MKPKNLRALLVAQIAGQIASGMRARNDMIDAEQAAHEADEIVTYIERDLIGEPIYEEPPTTTKHGGAPLEDQ